MKIFEFIQEDISRDMKNIKDILMLNKVLDNDDRALLTQVWNSKSVPIEKKEAYIEMLMDKATTSEPEADPVEEPVKTTTNYTPTSNNKFKTAKLKGHGKGRPSGLPKWWERAVQLKRQNPNMGAWELIANIDDTVQVGSFGELGDVKKGVNKRMDLNIDDERVRYKWVGYTLDDNEMKRWLTQPIQNSENWAWAKNNTYPPFKMEDFPKDRPRLPRSLGKSKNDDQIIYHPSLTHLQTYLPYNYERLEPAQRQQAYQSITKAKEKVASIGHNRPPEAPPDLTKRITTNKPKHNFDPDTSHLEREPDEQTGWEQTGDRDEFQTGLNLDQIPNTSRNPEADHMTYRPTGGGEPLTSFDGPLVNPDNPDGYNKDNIHTDLDSLTADTPQYINDIETEYQNGATPSDIAQTLSQRYGLDLASALKIVDNWANFNDQRSSKDNAEAKRIRRIRTAQRAPERKRKFYRPKQKEVSENLNEFHKEYQMAVKKLSEISNSN